MLRCLSQEFFIPIKMCRTYFYILHQTDDNLKIMNLSKIFNVALNYCSCNLYGKAFDINQNFSEHKCQFYDFL